MDSSWEEVPTDGVYVIDLRQLCLTGVSFASLKKLPWEPEDGYFNVALPRGVPVFDVRL